MKLNPLIGEARDTVPVQEVLEQMRGSLKPGCQWFAFQNHDLGSRLVGHLQFLQVGPGCTYKNCPDRMPDTKQYIGWRYVPVGVVDLETGTINTETEV